MNCELLQLDDGSTAPFRRVSSLIVGSGAAGLNAAIQLSVNGETDVAIYTEGVRMGTSINTGSDKQTYYKLGMYGVESDSPEAMASSLFDGGSTHGDIALVESSASPRAFFNLVNLGVPFPTDSFGQYVGYKTDHDPSRRATSVGPRTSRIMCEKLLTECGHRGIEMVEKRVAVSLLTINDENGKRAVGAIFAVMNANSADEFLEVVLADNVVFAVGGPGGLYSRSVYPHGQTGAIGLALMEGVEAVNLPESQYGLASLKFRWNVSGTYMQVLPRFISTDAHGEDEREFLCPYFDGEGEMNSAIFLKGYQWPFDPSKVRDGSSIIDLLVFQECETFGRRVFLDYTRNSANFAIDDLSDEAKSYLANSGALSGTPIDRLKIMNPESIELYKSHNIDIAKEPLEIAVCAQHNNGGLAGNTWWESTNTKHFFPIGEVNGSHGVVRPGGTALNSGQVGGFRAAELISKKYNVDSLPTESAKLAALHRLSELRGSIERSSIVDWRKIRRDIGDRMSQFGGHIRSASKLTVAVEYAWRQYGEISKAGVGADRTIDMIESLRNRQLCFAHAVYLESILFAINSGVGSRGSALSIASDGVKAHPRLGSEWNFALENPKFRKKLLTSVAVEPGNVACRWIDRRLIPVSNAWFETTWHEFCENKHLN